MIKGIWNIINSAFILAVISFIIDIINRKKDSIRRFLVMYEIKNDNAVFFLVQSEILGLIFSMLISGMLVQIFTIGHNWSLISGCMFILVFSTLINLVIVLICFNVIKQMQGLSRKNLIVVILLNLIFTFCLIVYLDDRLVEYTKYTKYIILFTFVLLFIMQFVLNCKKVQIKKIVYKIDTLDFEHYITNDDLIYRAQFILIKLKNGLYIEIPISRIKKITYEVCRSDGNNN